MSELYKVRPSQIISIEDDEYASYCFDMACAYIIMQMKNEETPIYDEDREYGQKHNPLLEEMMSGLF